MCGDVRAITFWMVAMRPRWTLPVYIERPVARAHAAEPFASAHAAEPFASACAIASYRVLPVQESVPGDLRFWSWPCGRESVLGHPALHPVYLQRWHLALLLRLPLRARELCRHAPLYDVGTSANADRSPAADRGAAYPDVSPDVTRSVSDSSSVRGSPR